MPRIRYRSKNFRVCAKVVIRRKRNPSRDSMERSPNMPLDLRRVLLPPFADLLPPHRVIKPLVRQKLGVAAELDDAAPIEHIDSIGVHHGRKPMRDQARDRLLAGGDVANGLADLFLGQGIERGCRLVEYQQLRIPEQRAGDREALLFSARYFHATLANQGIEAAIGTQKQALHGSLPQHVQALLIGRMRLDEEQVLADRSREQLRILGHESDPLAQML